MEACGIDFPGPNVTFFYGWWSKIGVLLGTICAREVSVGLLCVFFVVTVRRRSPILSFIARFLGGFGIPSGIVGSALVGMFLPLLNVGSVRVRLLFKPLFFKFLGL